MHESAAKFVQRFRVMGLTGTPAAPVAIHALEDQLGVVFPAAYVALLLILGRNGGPDFCGTDCTIPQIRSNWEGAVQLLKENHSSFALPEKAVVFMMHQGYNFCYFVADGTADDPPVYAYMDGDPMPMRKADSISAWLEL
jgi:hypothetical protein